MRCLYAVPDVQTAADSDARSNLFKLCTLNWDANGDGVTIGDMA
jgi:hypothetical protein